MKFNPWVFDPKTKSESVSLTLLLVSFLIACTAIGLNIAKVTENTSSSAELFMACAGLYFGRKLSFKGSDFGTSDSSSQEAPVVEKEGKDS